MAKAPTLVPATTLQSQMAAETDPRKKRVLRAKLASLAAATARAEYEAKARPLRRSMAGAY